MFINVVVTVPTRQATGPPDLYSSSLRLSSLMTQNYVRLTKTKHYTRCQHRITFLHCVQINILIYQES